MELVASEAELAKALSDLPIGIICIPFFIILMGERFKNGERNGIWVATFVILGLAAFLGSFAHAVVMGDMALRFLWVVLYLLMFLAVYLFYVLVDEIFEGKEIKGRQKTVILGLTTGMYLAAAGIRLATGKNMIAIFAVYALVVVIQMGVLIVRTKSELREIILLKISIGILLIGLLCQGAVFVFPDFNGAAVAHIFIIIAMFTIFMAAREDCGKRKGYI